MLELGGVLATMGRGLRGPDIADLELARIWDLAVRDYALLRQRLAVVNEARRESFATE